MDVETDYRSIDRAGDLEMETQFHRLYALADDDEEREAVARAFVVWQRTEQREELAVVSSVAEATTLLRGNNEFWLGSWVPDGDGGAA